MKHSQRAFTLIELLVVIAIIGGLSSLLVPNFMAARARARDAQRKSDLKQMQSALELYQQDQSPPTYPASLPAPGGSWDNCSGSPMPSCQTTTTYMKKMPGDPQTAVPTPYYYSRDATDVLKYTLCSCLENKADPDGESGDCSATYACSSGLSYTVTQP